MKVKNILAATGLLVLAAATGASAQTTYPVCKSGSIVTSPNVGMGAVGAGYLSPGGTFWSGNRYVALTCDAGMIVPGAAGTNSDNWAGAARTFVISATPAYDPDGKYATVLTALALGKKVSFIAQNFGTTTPDDDATCKVWNTSVTPKVCTSGNRIIMAIGILPANSTLQ